MQRDQFELSESEMADGTHLVALRGELDMLTCPQLTKCLEALGEAGANVRLDLSGLSFMDSTGVRVLYSAAKHARDGGSGLEIVPPVGEPMRVLEITGVNRLLPFVGADTNN
jgi:anti-sigma B factor antagonist